MPIKKHNGSVIEETMHGLLFLLNFVLVNFLGSLNGRRSSEYLLMGIAY